MKIARTMLLAVAAIIAVTAFAQDQRLDDMQKFAQEMKRDKKAFVEKQMNLTPAEARKFWPRYEAYQKDLSAINDRLGKLILTYADAHNSGKMKEGVARSLLREIVALEEVDLKLKRDHIPRLREALPATKVLRYLQIENKIRAVIRFELAANIPLAQ